MTSSLALLPRPPNRAHLDDGYDFYPDDWLVACALDPYGIGVFEHGYAQQGSFTVSDLAYDSIDYRSFAL